MNRFQLKALAQADLVQLLHDVKTELNQRSKVITRGATIILRAKKKSNASFETLEVLNEEITAFNSSQFLSIPQRGTNRKFAFLSPYLPSLLRQDWSHLYSGGDLEPKYYVYAHVDPRATEFVAANCAGGLYKGQPFYIGKGCGNRAFDFKRNQGHGKVIQEILNAGYSGDKLVKIIAANLTEAQAFQMEAKLIYFFGSLYKKTHPGILVNLDIPPTPDFVGKMALMRSKGEWMQYQEKQAALSAQQQGAI